MGMPPTRILWRVRGVCAEQAESWKSNPSLGSSSESCESVELLSLLRKVGGVIAEPKSQPDPERDDVWGYEFQSIPSSGFYNFKRCFMFKQCNCC